MSARPKKKKLDHMRSLKANNLAMLVLDCERATKKGSESHGFLEGETVFRPRVIPTVARQKKKKLDHMRSLKANNLAMLVLDCERATKKGSESHGFLEGETVFRPRVIPTVAITRTEIWFERSAVSRRSVVDKKSERCLSCAIPCTENLSNRQQ